MLNAKRVTRYDRTTDIKGEETTVTAQEGDEATPATAKTTEQRQKAFIAACRRSGFEGFEILQILADWYGWQKLVITSAPGITEHTVTNAWSQTDTEKKYRTSRGTTSSAHKTYLV